MSACSPGAVDDGSGADTATTDAPASGGEGSSSVASDQVGGSQSDPADCVLGSSGLDQLDASADPPCGLEVDEVPLFVSMGFDDNAYSGLEGSAGEGGMRWILDALAERSNPGAAPGSGIQQTFFVTSTYVGQWISESPTLVKRVWNEAYLAGHEIGNHSHTHPHGESLERGAWADEMAECIDWLTKPFEASDEAHTPNDASGIGVEAADILGFRTPYLEYSDATLAAVSQLGFAYDCSIEDGWQSNHDGTNYNWPYTLHEGSPGHDVLVDWGQKQAIDPYPGLWELPVHPVIVPPDDECEAYGVEPGFRDRMKALHSWFDVDAGKITGFDYNLWVQFEMTAPEFLATLKYTFDLRRRGNRAPMLFGTHSDYYSSKYTAPKGASAEERRAAIESFMDYVLGYEEVRMVPYIDVLAWMRKPAAISRP